MFLNKVASFRKGPFIVILFNCLHVSKNIKTRDYSIVYYSQVRKSDIFLRPPKAFCLDGSCALEWKRLDVDCPPAACPPCQYSCPKTSNQVMTSCDVMMSHITWHHIKWCEPALSTHLKILKSCFSTDLDLWPRPSNSSEILSRSTPPPNFGSAGQTVQPGECWQTHRRDRFYTLGRWRRREWIEMIALIYSYNSFFPIQF